MKVITTRAPTSAKRTLLIPVTGRSPWRTLVRYGFGWRHYTKRLPGRQTGSCYDRVPVPHVWLRWAYAAGEPRAARTPGGGVVRAVGVGGSATVTGLLCVSRVSITRSCHQAGVLV